MRRAPGPGKVGARRGDADDGSRIPHHPTPSERVTAAARRRRRAPDRAAELAREIASAVVLEPATAAHVAAILRPGDLPAPAQHVVDAVGYLARSGRGVTLPDVAAELRSRDRLASVGGEIGLAQLVDVASTAVYAIPHARELREIQRAARRQYVYARLAADPDDAEALAELADLEREAAAPARLAPIDLGAVAFTGTRLRAIRDRPESVSPLPGWLDPEPHLHVLIGKPKSGKTTFALDLARSWAQGVAPWPGAPPLPGSRALVISREQPVSRIDATLRRLARHAGAGNAWEDRIAIMARDPELPDDARRLLRLDLAGLAALRGALLDARDRGAPVGYVVLDSLSRLKPPGLEERDNDGLTEWLDALEEIASSCGVWLVLIHHVGHTTDAGRGEARSAGRGASAIAAVAQVVWLYERVRSSPRLRRVEIDGNAVLPAEHHLEVSAPRSSAGAIEHHRPSDPLGGHDPHELLGREALSLTALAWRIAGEEPATGRKPPGAALRIAGELASRWERAGLVDVTDGPHGARLVSLRGEIEEPPDA